MTKRTPAPKHRPERFGRAVIYENAVGATFMFFSWLGQNVYHSEMSSALTAAQQHSQFITAEMSKALTWMLTFQSERRKDKQNTEIILNSALGYAETVQTIVAAASRVDPASKVLEKHVQDHSRVMRPLKIAAAKRDTKEVEEIASAMMLWFGRIGPDAHAALNQRVQTLSDHEERAKWAFLGLFIIGSLLFAGTWWKANFAGNGKARKI